MADELFDVLAATLDRLGLELVDLELRSAVARVVIDREGGVDLDTIAEATGAVSRLLDEHDPFPGHRYTLEVSSPGLERPLRTPGHFARAVGEQVSVRRVTGSEGERRVQGVLTEVDDSGITLTGDGLPETGIRISFEDVERARTVFSWGGSPKPSAGSGRAKRRAGKHSSGAAGSQKIGMSDLAPETTETGRGVEGAKTERVRTI